MSEPSVDGQNAGEIEGRHTSKIMLFSRLGGGETSGRWSAGNSGKMREVVENQQHTECYLLRRTLRTRPCRRRFLDAIATGRNALVTSLNLQQRSSLTWKRKCRSLHIERWRREHKPEVEK